MTPEQYTYPATLLDKVPPIPAICPQCARRAEFPKEVPTILLVYCEHQLTGATVNLAVERPLWTSWGPIFRAEWDAMRQGALNEAMAKHRVAESVDFGEPSGTLNPQR